MDKKKFVSVFLILLSAPLYLFGSSASESSNIITVETKAQHLLRLVELNARTQEALDEKCGRDHLELLKFSTCCTQEVLKDTSLGKEQNSFLTYAVGEGKNHWYIKKMIEAGADLEYKAFDVVDSSSYQLVDLADDEEIVSETGLIINSATGVTVPGKKALKTTALRKAINRNYQSLTEMLIHEGASLETMAPEEPAVILTPKQVLFVRNVRRKDWDTVCRAVALLYPNKKFSFVDEERCPFRHDNNNFRGDTWYLERIKSACEEGCFLCLEAYLGASNHIDMAKIEALDKKTREWTDEKGLSYLDYALRIDSPYCMERLNAFGIPIPFPPYSLGTKNPLRYSLNCKSFHAADKLIQKGMFARFSYLNSMDNTDDLNYLQCMLRYAYLVKENSNSAQQGSGPTDDSLDPTLKSKIESGDLEAQKQAVHIFLRMLSIKKFNQSLSISSSFTEPVLSNRSIKDLAVEFCAQKISTQIRKKMEIATVTKLIADAFDEILA